MKCPNCGTSNGDNNRYCRECGLSLNAPDEKQATSSGSAGPADESRLRDELLEVWQQFESGRVDEALEKSKALVAEMPDSAAAHSLVALIYEYKAEAEIEEGRTGAADDYVREAIGHYETIIDLNPDSAADREKLAELRGKLSGRAPAAPAAQPQGLKAVLKSIPAPVFAAAFAFFVVLVLAIILMPGSRNGAKKPEEMAQQVVAREASAGPVQAAPKREPIRVYNFPEPSVPARVPPAPKSEVQPAAESPVSPMPIPSIGPGLPMAPPGGNTARTATPVVPSGAGDSKVKTGTEGAEPTAPSPKPATGSSMLAEALKLHDEGRSQEAIGAAQQAIVLFQKEIDSGKNVDAAERGIRIAKSKIEVWQQSIVVSE